MGRTLSRGGFARMGTNLRRVARDVLGFFPSVVTSLSLSLSKVADWGMFKAGRQGIEDSLGSV